ncbi:putative V-type proton ATPase 116 kDa subunit a [Monocercomonoides exilis]|uniref:putative V-type proton ATPase 116 kDa subunit a n=1 Tax=Monocercomonoides exilis TaxID=2049356 RepID=UPI003559D9CE|nr:putative V-type proton ATPase 116 kDa subunit a [Monocercomonoides exilis]
MDIYRSEPMVYMQFVFPRDAAYASMKELGEAGSVHFKDLNPNVNQGKREYSGEIRRCNELKRSIRFFHSQLEKMKIVPDDTPLTQELSSTELGPMFEELETDLKHLIQGEDDLNRHRIELIEMRHVLSIGSKFFEKTMGQASTTIASATSFPSNEIADDKELKGPDIDKPINPGSLMYSAGIISQSKMEMFYRMIFVALRGNVLVESEEVPVQLVDLTTQQPERKRVFMLFYSGEHARNKIMRICSSFGASVYPFPSSPSEHLQQIAQIDERLQTLQAVQERSAEQMQQRMLEIKAHFNQWRLFVAREKAIYSTLNLFASDRFAGCVVGEGWVAEREVEKVHMRLAAASTQAQSQIAAMAHVIPTKRTPPTKIRSTKFTSAFQAMVDAYGTAHYREVNPALFCLFTFPFLFGVMFGDFGHGILLALVGLVFCVFEKRLSKGLNDLIEYLYIGRYMILIMGLFAAYCGLLYNECFSLSMNLFGSRYKCVEVEENHRTETVCHFIEGRTTYPFGVDPIWRQSTNNLVYTNSMKMKMSVILGVCHMTLGLFLSLFNHINKHSLVDVICTFIPQFLLLMSLFGYMSFMIIYKWMTPVEGHAKPMLIRTMINMFLAIGQKISDEERLFEGQEKVQLILVIVAIASIVWLLVPKPIVRIVQHAMEERKEKKEKETPQTSSSSSSSSSPSSSPSSSSSSSLSHSTPPRPIHRSQSSITPVEGGKMADDGEFNQYFHPNGSQKRLEQLNQGVNSNSSSSNSSSNSSSSTSINSSDLAKTEAVDVADRKIGSSEKNGMENRAQIMEGEGNDDEEEEEEEFSIGEMCVHQLIDVIEYVLGCVSNTASYLRLWALSLAHGELAEVFFNYLILVIGKLIPVFGLLIGTAAWIGATVGILLAMEGLSAFLHCLRLHWVEFQNKFYAADGHPFLPLSFKVVDAEATSTDMGNETREY